MSSVKGIKVNEVRWFIRDNSGCRKMNDEEDKARDLVLLGVRDNRESFELITKVVELKPKLRNTQYYFLLDVNPSDGSFKLPNGISAVTDHPWDVAIKVEPNSGKIVNVIWGMSLPPAAFGINNLSSLIRGVSINQRDNSISVSIDKQIFRKLVSASENYYVQVISVHKPTNSITDSFNYPKPWENSNFLVGAFPVSKFINLTCKDGTGDKLTQ